jgi:tRNA(Arg) A34 adenosine deaminase TadA
MTKRFIRPEGHNCGISTHIGDLLTFGTGKLDGNGFWERPCEACARAHEQQFPEDGPCWPHTEEDLRAMGLLRLSHNDLMREAMKLALESEGGPFGAVVVKDGRIVGEGCNHVVDGFDPTAHAEIVAIRSACSYLETHVLRGCDIYTTCEPCPMCLAAIYWAGIDRIFYAAGREHAAAIGFRDQSLYEEIARPLSERKIPIQRLDKWVKPAAG